jgi:hypothetical protein
MSVMVEARVSRTTAKRVRTFSLFVTVLMLPVRIAAP